MTEGYLISMSYEYLDKNIGEVRADIEAARAAAGRTDEVLLLAAVKSADVEEINYIHRELGINDIGENRVQQLLARYDELDRDGLNIHFIGSLQSNKVKYIIDKVCMIHSLDSISLAKEIDRQARKHGKIMDVLIEINIGKEENKSGIMPEDAERFFDEVEAFENIRVRGFMTMAPKCEKNSEFRKYFAESYRIFLDIFAKKSHNIREAFLSMGMSDSYECAILEGSNIVRVGSAIFGSRIYK